MPHDTPDDLSFLDLVDDVTPLSQDKINSHDASRAVAEKERVASSDIRASKRINPLSLDNITPVKPDDFLSYQQPGIQDGVFKNLRLGKYTIESKIVVTGMPLKDAADKVFFDLQRCHAKGYRAVLIQHGRGEQSQPFPAFKKSFVNHWLGELECVIAYHSAMPQHGGLGATYVLLKKHAQQKQINREQNRKR